MTTPRIFIDQSSLRVSRAGIDATTAPMQDLLMHVGMRSGQILASGSFGLTRSEDTLHRVSYDGSGSFPAMSRVPDVLAAVQTSDGLAHLDDAIDNFAVGQYDIYYSGLAVTVSTNGLSVHLDYPYNPAGGRATPQAILFVVYRKPLLS